MSFFYTLEETKFLDDVILATIDKYDFQTIAKRMNVTSQRVVSRIKYLEKIGELEKITEIKETTEIKEIIGYRRKVVKE